MYSWDEIKTAYHVARAGTVSGAAETLGVHHATVIRHIDTLEERLGVKLFQRHARGYTPTEAGHDLLRVARTTDDQFSQLAGRLRGGGHDMRGELVVTSLDTMSHLLVPALARFRAQHPQLTIRYLTSDRLFRLEYGEAHVAIRAGAAPEQPDNVVQPFVRYEMALYASKAYAAANGIPESPAEFAGHRFIALDDPASRSPFSRWINANVPTGSIIFRSNDAGVLRDAVAAGAGIGFVSCLWAQKRESMIRVMPPLEDWYVQLWLVTHMDLHRIAKVQTFLKFLKSCAKDWQAS